MDGENNGKPYEQMDDLGVYTTPIFGSTPICGSFSLCGVSFANLKPPTLVHRLAAMADLHETMNSHGNT